MRLRSIRCETDSRGFALPTVILLVALLTVLLTSGLSRVQADRQIAHASEETGTAFAIAQTGLQTYMGAVTARPANGDSVRVNVVGGYANVVVHLLRNPADTMANALYLVRSTGVTIKPSLGSTPQARRVVAQFAIWQTGYIERRGALVTANGLRKRSGAATLSVSGADLCGSEGPAAGIRTTTVTGPPNPVISTAGAPPLIEEGGGMGPAIAAQTDIDWAAAFGGDIVPDYTGFRQGDTTFTIQLVSGNLTLGGTSTGSGLLMVTQNLFITGTSFNFEGLILVGGKAEFAAASSIVRGMVITGLNEQLGVNPQQTEIGGAGQDLTIRFDACRVNRALIPLTGLAPVQNAWLDSWAVY